MNETLSPHLFLHVGKIAHLQASASISSGYLFVNFVVLVC